MSELKISKEKLKIVEERDTVGKISSDLLQKQPDSRNPIEIQKEMQQNYMDNLVECVEIHKKIYPTDFFVVVETKREPLMHNVFRGYFFARLTCPTPNYDQSVYFYNSLEERIEYVWTIPDRETSHLLQENKLYVPLEERQLLEFVLQFADGSLYKRAKELNGEELETSLLIN